MRGELSVATAFLLFLTILVTAQPQADAQAAPQACVIADGSAVAKLAPQVNDVFEPTDISVDQAGRVITSWFASIGVDGVDPDNILSLDGVGAVVAHELDGTMDMLGSTLDMVEDRPMARPFSVAVSRSNDVIFVAERTGDGDRILRRSPSGEWSEALRDGVIINTQPYTRAEDLSVMANGAVYLTQSSLTPEWRRNRVMSLRNGQATEVMIGFQSLNGVATDDSQPRAVWTVDSKARRVYKVDVVNNPVALTAEEIEGFDLRFIDGAKVRTVNEIAAVDGGALLSVVMADGATQIVRLASDGAIEAFIDAQTPVAGQVLNSVVGLDVGENGDVYIADAGNSRVLRLPANPASPCVGVVLVGPDSFELAANINCDTNPDVVDALFIVQYNVGVREGYPTCPLPDPENQINVTNADLDGDGAVTAIDALLVALCDVDVPTVACPAD